MKYFDWNEEKNQLLKNERDISFEDILIALDSDGLLDIIEHPNPEKYPNQKVLVVNIRNYVYLVPFIEDDKNIF